MRNRIASFLMVAALASLGGGCATLGAIEQSAAGIIVSDQQESQLGLQVKQQLDAQSVVYVQDPVIVDYVRGVANKVLTFAMKERAGVTWQVNVINDPGTINAFATPGGYLYVYTGLLLLADNEAQLATVMGHEAGHVVARHSAQAMVDQFGLDAVAQLALGQNAGALSRLGKQFAEKGVLLAHSRAHEDQADEYGARYASMAGYDPHGLSTFFEKLKAKVGDTSGLSTWLSDHPATSERIAHINGLIASNNLGGTDTGADRFAPVRERVKALPAPPPKPASPAAAPASPKPAPAPSRSPGS